MQRLEQAGVNIKGAILNGVIKRASTAYSYGYNYYGYSYSEKSKTESGRMRRERLFRSTH